LACFPKHTTANVEPLEPFEYSEYVTFSLRLRVRLSLTLRLYRETLAALKVATASEAALGVRGFDFDALESIGATELA